MATLQQVADQAGVSIATVSKVLSNTPYVSEETRQKVLRAVDELGYLPNLAGRALSTGKTHIVGVVFPYLYDTIFADPLVLRILEGIESECRQHGYNILLSTPRVSRDGLDDQYLTLVQSGYLDGLIALDNVPLISVLKPAIKKAIPAVAIGYHDEAVFVRSDDTQGGYALMKHILDLGHRHIGLISVADNINYAIPNRVAGMKHAAQEHRLDFDNFPVILGDFSTQSGAKCTQALLEAYPQLTAVVCVNDRMALGAMQTIQNMGLKVPDDVSVVGYDDIPTAHYTSPALTTINQQAPELGRRAMQLLLHSLQHDKLPTSVILPTELVVRQSSAAPR